MVRMNPKPNEVKEKPEGKSGKRKTVSCLTLTLTLIGKIVQKSDSKKPKGEKKGKRVARLTSPSSTPARAGKREANRKGARLAGIRPQGRRGQAARRRRAHPLGNAHAGEGGGDGAGTSLLRHGCSLGDSLRREGESSAAKRESVRVK